MELGTIVGGLHEEVEHVDGDADGGGCRVAEELLF